MSHKENGSSWRSQSLNNSYFDDETYDDKKVSPKRIIFHNEPQNEDYDELCKRLSGEVRVLKNTK